MQTSPENAETPTNPIGRGSETSSNAVAGNILVDWNDSPQSAARSRARKRTREAWERHQASRELDALLAEMYPSTHSAPSTFSLTSTELRAHGNYLVQHDGWSVSEVLERLALPMPERVR